MPGVTNHEGNGHQNHHEMPAWHSCHRRQGQCWRGCGETATLTHGRWGYKRHTGPFENHKQVLKSLSAQLPYGPATLLLRKTEQEWQYMCTCPCSAMFSGALFIIAKPKGKIPLKTKCLSTAEWGSGGICLNEMVHNSKNKATNDICNHMDDRHKSYTELRRPIQKNLGYVIPNIQISGGGRTN